jgi:hypothetical protein
MIRNGGHLSAAAGHPRCLLRWLIGALKNTATKSRLRESILDAGEREGSSDLARISFLLNSASNPESPSLKLSPRRDDPAVFAWHEPRCHPAQAGLSALAVLCSQ